MSVDRILQLSAPLLRLVVAASLTVSLVAAASADETLHHRLELTLEPESGSLEVRDVIETGGHERLALELAPGLSIEDLVVDGETVEPPSRDGVVSIELPTSGDHRVEIAYGGVLEAGGAGRGLSPMVTTEGAFLPYGIGWLAHGGTEDQTVTYVVSLDVPAPYKALATGDLVSETEEDGRYQAVFATDGPNEPPSVFAGDLRIHERRHDGLRLRTYFPADQTTLSSAYLDQVAGYIDRFSDEIGAYPYDSFAVIAAPLPVGLGFPGTTYVSSQILGMPFMLTRSLAHEILHNWWANGVFLDISEGNWAEGLTTYMADYALAETEGDEAAWQMRLGWLRDFAALPEERDRPIAAFRSKGHDADQVVGYNKVAMVFHMLKRELGEDWFMAGLRSFWERHRFETATWSDLRSSFEAASGRALDDFFDPWLTRKGAPALSLDSADLRASSGGHLLNLGISSDSADYDLLVPVQIETAGGVEQRTVRLVNGVAEASFAFAERPLAIGVDQRHDLFRRLAADEAPPILRDVTLAADTLTVLPVNGSEQAGKIALTLAERTLDTNVSLADLDDEAVRTSPLMLIGLREEMTDALAAAGIDPPPDRLGGKGTARSWVSARKGAPPVLVVEAEDEAALSALLRPLPHYGRQSFLVFEGSEAIDKGVWPAADNALTLRFD